MIPRPCNLIGAVAAVLLAGCAASGQAQTAAPAATLAPTAAPAATSSGAPASAPASTALAAPTPEPPSATATPPALVDTRGQSARVPDGFPTPTTAYELLQIGGPAHDPGSLDWAHPGPYIAPSWTDFRLNSFAADQRVASTYYFYWHDLATQVENGTYTDRFNQPPDPAHYSFLLPETHQREFSDMLDAGLDFVLPVYWGEPGHPGRTTAETYPHYWSTEGIPPMVEALDRMAAAGSPPLQMGMFYDTSILANADLTTPNGKEYFYVNIRDYFSRIPPKYWAAIGGRPIIFLYDTIWVNRFDQSTIDYVYQRFAQDFDGLQPYIVSELQWDQSKGIDPPQPVRADGVYVWGAAPSGFNTDPDLTVSEVGPGFKNTQYCTGGPQKDCFDIDRQDGARYRGQLQQALVTPGRNMLVAETWNELSEGSDIQETLQTGRLYIDLTRQYAEAFKAGLTGPVP